MSAHNFSLPFNLEVDASAVGAGAVLLQEDPQGVDHPVAYFSRKFDKHQIRYSTFEKETRVLLYALQHFKVYLASITKPTKVFTDHNPLVFLSRMYNNSHHQMRWSLIAQSYNLEINHKKGSENLLADALSRASVSELSICFCLVLSSPVNNPFTILTPCPCLLSGPVSRG